MLSRSWVRISLEASDSCHPVLKSKTNSWESLTVRIPFRQLQIHIIFCHPICFQKHLALFFLLFCHPICSQKKISTVFLLFCHPICFQKNLAMFFLFISVFIYIYFSLSHLVRISLEAKYLQHLSAQLIYYISLHFYLLCESASVSDPV